MKIVSCLLLFISIKATSAQPVLEPAERESEWYELQMGKIDRAENLPNDEKIEFLGSIVRIGRRGDLDKEQKAVLERSRTMLLSIPGHAEHYRKQMEEGMTRFEATPEGRRSLLMGAFGTKQSEIFQTLEVMPSPEAVKVLGDYLSDERGWDSNKGHEVPRDSEGKIDGEGLMNVQRKNCDMAVGSLARLIENPPERENVYPTIALPAWRLWYNQVKAGNRTYRFKGNPTEYDLHGPVTATKAPDIKRSDRRAIAGSSAEARKEEERSNNPTIVAIVLAVLIGGGYWAYRRKKLV